MKESFDIFFSFIIFFSLLTRSCHSLFAWEILYQRNGKQPKWICMMKIWKTIKLAVTPLRTINLDTLWAFFRIEIIIIIIGNVLDGWMAWQLYVWRTTKIFRKTFDIFIVYLLLGVRHEVNGLPKYDAIKIDLTRCLHLLILRNSFHLCMEADLSINNPSSYIRIIIIYILLFLSVIMNVISKWKRSHMVII